MLKQYIPCIYNDSNFNVIKSIKNYEAVYIDSKGHFTLMNSNRDNWIKIKVGCDDIIKVMQVLSKTGGTLDLRFNEKGFGVILNRI